MSQSPNMHAMLQKLASVDNSWDNSSRVWKTPVLTVGKYNGILPGDLQIVFAP
jgi:hypothetical protein